MFRMPPPLTEAVFPLIVLFVLFTRGGLVGLIGKLSGRRHD